MRQTAKRICLFQQSRKKKSFLYLYTHLILVPKVENIVAIHCFARNTKYLIEFSNLLIYIYIIYNHKSYIDSTYSTSKWKEILNRETGKYVYLHKVEKNVAVFFIFRRI